QTHRRGADTILLHPTQRDSTRELHHFTDR
ncbi:MAG: hypothetical protein ACJAXA_002496, partial [Candidatus Aldehydirespiratoraceae bacterium]